MLCCTMGMDGVNHRFTQGISAMAEHVVSAAKLLANIAAINQVMWRRRLLWLISKGQRVLSWQ
jgi:hypothetical protein